jgi:hypothetical protein
MSTLGRAVAVICLLIVAAGSGLVGFGAISNLWADYQDSPTSTYLLIGIPGVVLCVTTLWAAVTIIRDPSRPRFTRHRPTH